MTRRRQPLPSNWSSIRKKILQRDNYVCCNINCNNIASHVDHIDVNLFNNHNENNLQSLCSQCHSVKTANEAVNIKKEYKIKNKNFNKEIHPRLRMIQNLNKDK